MRIVSKALFLLTTYTGITGFFASSAISRDVVRTDARVHNFSA